jgi:hypothetical protein
VHQGKQLPNEESVYRMGETLCHVFIGQVINIQNILRNIKQKWNSLINKWTKELNGQFSKDEVLMSNKFIKKHSTSLAIKWMQIRGYGEKESLHTDGRSECECIHFGNQSGGSSKLKVAPTYDLAIPLLGIS